MDKIKLLPRQKKFAMYYVESGNATDAYRRAYNTHNDNTARANGCTLLANPSIFAYIQQLTDEADAALIAKPREVLQYFTGVMRGEIKDAFGLDASISDRNRAAEMLGKRYGIFKDDTDDAGKDVTINIVYGTPPATEGPADG